MNTLDVTGLATSSYQNLWFSCHFTSINC